VNIGVAHDEPTGSGGDGGSGAAARQLYRMRERNAI